MFISQLKDKIVAYDLYGEHRTNGLKVLFILELLFIFNFIYAVDNPYFYFFYVPLTAFTAEIVGSTLEEKYLFLFFTLMGCVVSIFLFGVFSVYKSFFALFVFFYSLLLYYLVIHKLKRMLPLVPLILSLAVYSLIYVNADSNFYIALNNALQSFVAMLLMFLGLYFFPKRYYFFIWQRAFYDVLNKLTLFSKQIAKDDITHVPVFGGIIVMERYSKMLSKTMHYYSVLKITLLAFELIMSLSYLFSFKKGMKVQYIRLLTHFLTIFSEAAKENKPLVINQKQAVLLSQTHELKLLHQLILSWNYLCVDL